MSNKRQVKFRLVPTNANITASSGDAVLVSGFNDVTVTLPANPNNGCIINVSMLNDMLAVVTVNRNGNLVNGVAMDYVFSRVANQSLTFYFVDNVIGWTILGNESKGSAIYQLADTPDHVVIGDTMPIALPVFVNEVHNDSNSIVRLSDTNIQLLAFRKYRLFAEVRFSNMTDNTATEPLNDSFSRTSFRDVGAFLEIGASSMHQHPNYFIGNTPVSSCEVIVAPVTNIQIQLRRVEGRGRADLNRFGTRVEIREI